MENDVINNAENNAENITFAFLDQLSRRLHAGGVKSSGISHSHLKVFENREFTISVRFIGGHWQLFKVLNDEYASARGLSNTESKVYSRIIRSGSHLIFMILEANEHHDFISSRLATDLRGWQNNLKLDEDCEHSKKRIREEQDHKEQEAMQKAAYNMPQGVANSPQDLPQPIQIHSTEGFSIKPLADKFLSYLACPLAHEDQDTVETRVRCAAWMAAKIMQETKEKVFSPINHCHLINQTGLIESVCWDHWRDYDTAYLDHSSKCYLLLLPGWMSSVGMHAEINYCLKNDIPLYILQDSPNFEPIPFKQMGVGKNWKQISNNFEESVFSGKPQGIQRVIPNKSNVSVVNDLIDKLRVHEADRAAVPGTLTWHVSCDEFAKNKI